MNAPVKIAKHDPVSEKTGEKSVEQSAEDLRTERLVADFAARLGLSTAEARVDLSPESAALTRAHGAKGLMRAGVAHLDPRAFDAKSGSGRYLLAHEMTHLAQRAERRQTGDERPADVAAAEREAHAMGERAAALLPLSIPNVLLPPGAVAADSGVGTPHEAQEAEPRERPDSPAALNGRIAERIVPFPGALVAARAEIDEALDGWVSDGDMDDVLRILDAQSFVDAAAMLRSLGSERQQSFLDELSGSHYRNYRRSVIAGYAAVVHAQAGEFDEDHFEELDYGAMAREEIVALDLVLGTLTEQVPRFAAELLHSDAGAAIRERMLDPFGTPQPQRREGADRSSDDETADPQLTREEEALVGIRAELAISLLRDDPDEAKARAVLDLLRPFAPLVEPEGRPEGTSSDPDSLQLDEFGGSLRTVPPKLRRAGELLAEAGALDHLLEAVDKQDDALDPRYAGLFFSLMAFRPVWRNLSYVEDLLSTGFFNWVRDWEAEFAYRLLRALPLDAQYRFRQLEGGRYYRRLEEEISRDLIRSGVYIGIEVSRDEEGGFVSTVGDYAALLERGDRDSQILRSTVDDVLRMAEDRRGTGNWAETLFEAVWTIAAWETSLPHPSSALTFVVRRLDSLGALSDMINDLSDEFLFAEHRRPVTLEIFLARDPIHLQEHARQLMSTNWNIFTPWALDTAVTDRDAYVAFQLIRALPPHEQAAFMRRNNGEDFQAIWDELPERMRESRDMDLFIERDGGLNREDLRAQLAATEESENLWTAGRRHELDALIRLAITLGDYDFVFSQSEQRRAYRIAELRPIVDRYRLYDLNPGSIRTDPAPDELPTSVLSRLPALQFLQPLGRGIVNTTGTLTNLLDLFFRSDLLVGSRGGGYRLDLETVTRLMRHTLGDTSIDLGEMEREDRDDDENYADIWFDLPARHMHIDIPNLQIQRYNELFGTTRVDTGPITLRGLRVTAAYADEGFQQPASLNARMEDLKIQGLGLTSPASVRTFGEIEVRPLDLDARLEGSNTEAASSAPQGLWIPLPLLAPAFLGLLEVLGHLGRLKDRETYGELRSINIAFERLDVRGFATDSGIRLAALAVRDFELGVAMTRDEHLRLQIEQAERRREALSTEDRDGEPGAEIDRRLTQLRRQHRQAVEAEAARQELKRRYEQDPDSLSDDEVTRLVVLERSRRLGVTIDIGSVELSGLQSAVDIDSLTLEGISGGGESAAGLQILNAVGLPSLADPAVLDRFRNRLTREAEGRLPSQFDAEVQIGVRRVAAEGVGFTYIPSASIVQTMIDIVATIAGQRPEETRFADTQNRLEAALPDVRRYHELAEGNADGALAPADQRELADLRRRLRETFYISVERVNLQQARLTASLSRGDIGLGAETFTVETIRGLGIEIDLVEGEDVDLSLGLLAHLLQGVFHGRREAGADLFSSTSLHAGRLAAHGIRAEAFGFSADQIEVQGLDATVSSAGEGIYLLVISRCDSLILDNLDLRTTDQLLQAPGRVAVQNATMVIRFTTEQTTDESGEETRRVTEIHVRSADIGRVEYLAGERGPLIYERPAPQSFQPETVEGTGPQQPRRMRVEINRGALTGLFARGMTVDLSDAANMRLSGAAGIATIDTLQAAAIVKEAFQSPEGEDIVTHRVEGLVSGGASVDVVSGSTVEGPVNVNALEVNFVEGEMERLRFNDIDVSDGLLVIGNNEVAIRSLDTLSGDLQFEGDTIHVHGLSFQDAQVSRLRWETEGGTLFEARPTAHAQQFSLQGSVTLQNGSPQELTVDSFRIARLTASYFKLRDRRRNVTLEFDNDSLNDPGHQPIDVTELRATGLHWRSGQTLPDRGHVELGRLRALFEGSFGEQLSADGSLDLQGLDLQFRRGDRVITRFRDLDAEATVRYGDTEADVAVQNLRTGETGEEGSIDYRHGEGVTINQLRVGSLTLSRLDFESDSMRIAVPAPLPEGVAGPTAGDVVLSDITLSAEVDFPDSDATEAPPVQEIRVTELTIPTITARGLSVTLKNLGSGLTLTLPYSEPATISGVTLSAMPPEVAFRITAEYDFITGETDWLVRGLLNTGVIDVPRLQADLAGVLQADATLQVPSVTGQFFGDGTYRVSLNQPSISALRVDLGQVLPSAVITLLEGSADNPGEISADALVLTERGVEILAPNAGPFQFVVPDKGITIRVEQITGSPRIEVISREEQLGPVAADPDDPGNMLIRIPEASIRNVAITINDVSALMDQSTSDEETDFAELSANLSRSLGPLIDTADGHVNFDLEAFRSVEQHGGVTIETLPFVAPVRLQITDGRANLQRMRTILLASLARQINQSVDGLGTDLANLTDALTRFVVIGNRLHFQYLSGWSEWTSVVSFELAADELAADPPIVQDDIVQPVRLSTLMRYRLDIMEEEPPAPTPDPEAGVDPDRDRDEEPDQDTDNEEEAEEEGWLDQIMNSFKESAEVTNIDIDLSLNNDTAFPYTIGDPTDSEAALQGTVTFAPDTLTALRITGQLPDATLNLGLQQLALEGVDLTVKGFPLSTGAIELNGFTGPNDGPATLAVEGWTTPRAFNALVEEVTIRDVEFRMPNEPGTETEAGAGAGAGAEVEEEEEEVQR